MKTMPRMTITLPNDSAEALRAEAEEMGVSQSEVIRRALGYHRFLLDEVRAGRKIHTTNSDGGDRRDVVILL